MGATTGEPVERLEHAVVRTGGRAGRGGREAEVAELLDVSVGTVKSTLSRGLARLREVLGSDRAEGAAR